MVNFRAFWDVLARSDNYLVVLVDLIVSKRLLSTVCFVDAKISVLKVFGI